MVADENGEAAELSVVKGYEADYDHWLKLDEWSIWEATLLMCGYDPRHIDKFWRNDYPLHPDQHRLFTLSDMFYLMYEHTMLEGTPTWFGCDFLRELEEVLDRAVSANTLLHREKPGRPGSDSMVSPSIFLRYCKEKEFPIPVPLQVLLTREGERNDAANGLSTPAMCGEEQQTHAPRGAGNREEEDALWTGDLCEIFHGRWKKFDEWSLWEATLLMCQYDPVDITESWKDRDPYHPDDYCCFGVSEMFAQMREDIAGDRWVFENALGAEARALEYTPPRYLAELEEVLERAISAKTLPHAARQGHMGEGHKGLAYLWVYPPVFLEFCASRGFPVPDELRPLLTQTNLTPAPPGEEVDPDEDAGRDLTEGKHPSSKVSGPEPPQPIGHVREPENKEPESPPKPEDLWTETAVWKQLVKDTGMNESTAKSRVQRNRQQLGARKEKGRWKCPKAKALVWIHGQPRVGHKRSRTEDDDEEDFRVG